MHRQGIFDDFISFKEVKKLGKIGILMYSINLIGHTLFRFYTMPVLKKHIEINKDA